MKINNSPSNILVLSAIRVEPDLPSLQLALAEVEDWEQAGRKIIKKGVAGLFLNLLERHPELTDNLIPNKLIVQLQQAYLRTVSRSMVLYATFKDIADALNERGIKAIALKGVYLAEHLYPTIGLRQFSDIDLLFCKEDVPAALEVFNTLGFVLEKPVFDEHVNSVLEPAHLPHMSRRGVSVEVHTRLHGPFQEYNLNERELFDRSIPITINQCPFHVFEIHDLLIHLCVHLDKHINSYQLQFYSLADLVRILHTRYTEINPTLLLERSRSYGADKVVIRTLQLLHELLGAPLHPELSAAITEIISREHLEKVAAHLDDRAKKKPSTRTHLKYMNKFDSTSGKLRYVAGVLFPSKRTLIRSYKIQHQRLYWLWYPYRFWLGIKGLLVKK